MYKVFLLLSFLIAVKAGCDNACSGHGSCGEHGLCTCHDNWGLGLAHYAGDCSQRICPFEFAWVDTPDKIGNHHKYAECSARGICNRDTGDCECFPGYEGKGCQRTTCPNDCSGHGTCAYIQDLPFQSVPFDAYSFTKSGKQILGGTGDFLANEGPMTYNYYSWDKKKTRGCVCDPQYGDVDCSKRMCPYGTDVMDQRDNMAAQAKYQVQHIQFIADTNDVDNDLAPLNGNTFALTFKSRLNETFTTRPIVFDGTHAGFHDFILDVQEALESLPNSVIDKVEVHGSVSSNIANINVTFVGDNVQGPQHLLNVKSIVCGDGCTPQLTGLELQPATNNITEVTLSDYNSFECGRRGKCDYTTGICTCFAGYTGVACGTITSLV